MPSPDPTDDDSSTRRTLLRGAAAAAIGFPVAGCLDRREPSDPGAVEAVERSVEALDGVDGYESELSGRLAATHRDEDVRATLSGYRRVNERERLARARVDADGDVDEWYDRDADEWYLDGDTLYRRCSSSWLVNVEDAWYPEQAVDWEEATLAGSQRSLLDISAVYDRGTDALDGRELRVIEFAPDADAYADLERNGGVEDATEPSSVTLTQWLDEDGRPRRIESDVERSSRFGPTIRQEQREDVAYGAVDVEVPPLVDDEDECPRSFDVRSVRSPSISGIIPAGWLPRV
ncbi:hypothetical protein [Salinilacihabitans rarus]|uniref:hypothetical protein n=1 Tax=Salinilacihabitans rarus TaxID=2961596 RepID=UPI0020C86AA8|nr:hypothetical protein [Salinilacihabitans rarus]